jgi:thiamine kinase-like enzyme
MARRLVQLLLSALLVAACRPTPATSPALERKREEVKAKIAAADEGSSFLLEKAALRTNGMAPNKLAKINASAFRYSRMLSRQFEVRTCASFRDLRWSLPIVAVHGDAHIEQFVVTSDTYGVEDFDQAGYGPAVVDLVRYAASIHLATRELEWKCNAGQAV